MIKLLTHAAIGTSAMIACVLLAAWLPPFWQGVSGRDFRPWGTTAAVLILVVALTLRAVFRWQTADFLLSTLVAEIVTLCVIAHFTGFTWLEIFDRFNLSWLLTVSVLTAVPWLLGFLFGSAFLKLRKERSRGERKA